MSRKFWLWLWILALGLLIFFCVSSKLKGMKPKVEAVKPVVQEKKVEIKKPKLKDITVKIDKSVDGFSIAGILNSESDYKNLLSKYKNMKIQDLKYDKNHSNQRVTNLLMGLSDILQKFKSGFAEYHDGNLVIDGVVASKEDKESMDAVLSSIKDIKVSSNIVVEEPKPTIKHIGKLSITKEGDSANVSGIFSSETEINSLVKLLSDKGLNVKKELCVVDSDLKEDRWRVPFVLVVDDFVQLKKGAIQFDKDTFSVIGDTSVKGVKEDVSQKLLENKDDTITVTSDITYIAPKPTKEQVQEEVNSILKLKSIRFKTATAELISESKALLDEVADILLKNPNLKVKIAGHTDSSGNEKSNLILSQHRADTVKNYLVKKGISSENLTTVGYGSSKPLVKNNSDKNKQINRRVEFIIIGE